MLFAEALGEMNALSKDRLQIFATDIDDNALDVARRGRYSLAALDDIPSEFVEKYFTRDSEAIEVHQKIKDVILFSHHNLCQDPPFLHLDLICCRNLLIYFGVALQMKVLARLHYSLTTEGFLFLGTAETISVSEDLFKSISRAAHVYRKRYSTSSEDHFFFRTHKRLGSNADRNKSGAQPKNEPEELLDRALFDGIATALGPDAILLSEDHRIIRVYGDVTRYLTITEKSRLQFNVSVLTPALAQEARTLTTMSLRKDERRKGIVHRLPKDDGHAVQLEFFPVKPATLDESFMLVTFTRWQDKEKLKRDAPPIGDEETTNRLEAMEMELRSTREELQQTIEELETSNEELQSSNEELQSTNEELQATNEELETSNEELQSTNEELVTVNEELHVSSTELSMLNDEQDAVLASVASPLLIVDMALQITKANDAAIDLFQMKGPIDRPHLSQCHIPTGFPLLSEICNESMHLGKPINQQIETPEKVFTLQCAPFFNSDGQIRGATMLFV